MVATKPISIPYDDDDARAIATPFAFATYSQGFM